MKISEKWLREWVNPPADIQQIAEQLTMAGLEVEGREQKSIDLTGIVAAEVKAVEQHPDADNLKVCRVDSGSDELLNVVCGAANVRPGMRAALATAGTKLASGKVITNSSIRGVMSQGMLCSAQELGLAEEADELLELPVDVVSGQPLSRLVGGNDTILDIALTPNRGDCLSIQGIAREVSVINQCPLVDPRIDVIPPVHDATRVVHLEAGKGCPRYAGRRISGIRLNVQTPLWLQEKLLRAGVRCINPVVDITNYVMLELGQPMHAFDDDKLQGDIHVRFGKPGEKLTLLDGEICELAEDVLVIADDESLLAMAGIMGGEESAVADGTVNIFLESAWFDPRAISGVARRYGLHTESSHRFERGVDFTLQAVAVEFATRLIIDICGGEAGPVIESKKTQDLPARTAISLNESAIERLLGITVAADTVKLVLESLGMQVEKQDGSWRVIPPSWRFDLSIEVDLIEEIARITGYDNIQARPPRADLELFSINDQQVLLAKLRHLLVHRGYHEAITYSFVDEQLQQLLDPDAGSIALVNPIAADLAVMRTSLWPGLIIALQYNSKRQQSRIRLFEHGLIFRQERDSVYQIPVISGVICGNTYPKQWDIKDKGCDYFDIKSDVEVILAAAGIDRIDVTFAPSAHAALHPGQAAEIIYDNQIIGKLGEIHPGVQAKVDLHQPVYVFEIEISRISEQITPKYQKISKFPLVRRDIAILVDEEVKVAEIEQCIQETALNYLINLELFDVYQGEGIDLGKKSLALGLTFQGSSSTLTDEEVEAIMGDILDQLRSKLGGILRE